MKNFFSILLICFSAFAFADDSPVFDEVDDNECRVYAPIPFTAQEPVFEEDDEQIRDEVANTEEDNEEETLAYVGCGKCDDGGCDNCLDEEEEADETAHYCCDEPEEDSSEMRFALGVPVQRPIFRGSKDDVTRFHSYSQWTRYKSNFGMEKIFVRFPQKPAISQSCSLMNAYAYDHAVMYSFAGYFPPVGNIDPQVWFDEILYNVSGYPYSLISHSIFQISNGDWVMDYVVHDYVQNLVVKARAIITPFNGYILQCVKPNGVRDYFNYFLDNFWIKCECHG